MYKLGNGTPRQRPITRRLLDMDNPRDVDALFGRSAVDPRTETEPTPWEALVLSILGILILACAWGGYHWWLSMGGM